MTSRKVFFIVAALLLILTLGIITLVSINFQQFGIKNVKEKAELTAEAVRDGLTSHMVNGTMDKRFYFLDNMARHQKIENLRVLRSDTVIGEYGKGLDDERIRDDIDKEVLRSGETVTKFLETQKGPRLRVTIPYIATAYAQPNCLTCHSAAKEGDVLGAISMELDISDVRNEEYSLIYRTLGIGAVFLVVSLFLTHRMISPYVRLFEDLEEGIIKAYRGDFSYHITTSLKSQAGIVAKRLNELSDIYRFKKTIELDKDKKEVIKRLVHVFEKNLGAKQLVLFEINHPKNKQTLFYNSTQETSAKYNDTPQKCRAFRTGRIVVSTDFPELCEACSRENSETLCIPYRINAEYSLIVRMVSENPSEIRRLQNLLPVIRNYLAIAHPVIESKILMEILEEASYKDGLTELYNRRYLNGMLDENHFTDVSQVAVLMVDIDFFKEVNDNYGHDIGDNVIKGLAKVIKTQLSESDYGIRFGGEEFLLLLRECSEVDAEKRANELRESFAKLRFESPTKSFNKTLSVGIAMHPKDGDSIWRNIKYADIALYKAKEGGRNQVVRFRPEFFKEQEY